MAKKAEASRRLPVNAKAIARAVKACGKNTGVVEFRIEGVRGLVLHALPSGTATWFCHYDVNAGRRRQRRKLKLGRLDELSLAAAIRQVDQTRAAIQQGADPARQRAVLRSSMTFGELVGERFDKGVALRPATRRDYEYVLTKDILPFIGDKPAKEVSREDIIEILDRVSARGSQRRADLARAVISSIFNFGMDRNLVSSNPAASRRNRHDYQPRDVIASDNDIRVLWKAMDEGDAAMSASIAAIIKLALLTGLRRTEIAGMRKDELNWDPSGPTLTLPRGRAKNRNPHRIPLSPQAAALLRQSVQASGGGEYVFPGGRAQSPIAGRSVSQAMDRTRAKLEIEGVTVHDLRRTVGTIMSRLGVPKETRERILNHGGRRKGNITDGTYNLYEYDAEKRAALELLADAIDGILGRGPSEIDDYHVRLARLKGRRMVSIV